MKLRVPVINMSLSGPPNALLHAAIQRALDAGHLIVAAVGNGEPASPPLYPAAYDGVIAVTAVDGGQHVYRRASRGAHVQLSAMGVDVVAAAPAGLATYSGTSFASPYVAALAAIDYRSLDPKKALEVKEDLQNNALDLGKPGRDEVYGFGLARPRSIVPAGTVMGATGSTRQLHNSTRRRRRFTPSFTCMVTSVTTRGLRRYAAAASTIGGFPTRVAARRSCDRGHTLVPRRRTRSTGCRLWKRVVPRAHWEVRCEEFSATTMRLLSEERWYYSEDVGHYVARRWTELSTGHRGGYSLVTKLGGMEANPKRIRSILAKL